MIFLSNTLLSTKTYAKRSWVYLQATGSERGTLTITVQRSARSGAVCESESYQVEEDTEALLYGNRVFLLQKLADGEIYEVALMPAIDQ